MKVSIRRWPEAARTLYLTFGARGLALRGMHEGRRALNRFRTAPVHAVTSELPPNFFRVDAARLAAVTDRDEALERAGRVLAGEHQAYRWMWRALPNTPEAWLTHPATGQRAGADAVWWRVPHLDPGFGDIKDLWEPARFAWLYDLVRAYALTSDERYAEGAHQYLATWLTSSPPFRGPHWSCGQETAIRAIALLYAEANLGGAPSTDAEASKRLRDVLAASGERIADAIGYAVSQRNNHAISEAAGLVLLGVRFQGDHPEAISWLETGHRLLERLIPEQFAPDGWYIQHSFTYQRLALEQCVLAERGLRTVGRRLNEVAAERLEASVALLVQLVEPETGLVPNYGANDGAFVHPATLALYRDFRPVLTAASATWQIPLPADITPDPETLAWLGLPEPPTGPQRPDGVWSGESGWAVARQGGWQVFLRAGRYTSRPAHLDPLQLDVRFGGREMLVDPGSFAYNAPPPWRNGLSGAAMHNGPLLDGNEPGVRGPRFLWYLWPEAELLEVREEEDAIVLVAERPGVVRRIVHVNPRRIVVTDTVLAAGVDELQLRWLLHPDGNSAHIDVDGGTVHVAREEEAAGWFSPCYGMRLPSRYVEVRRPVQAGDAVITTFHMPGSDDPNTPLHGPHY